MIKTIAHFADIHVQKSLERHIEYREVFKQVYEKLGQQKPDRIVIVGDTYNDYIELEGEPLILIGELLTKFAQIAPVIITRGNHEIRKKNRNRTDTVRTVIDLLKNPRITYYDKSGFYPDDNVVWVVWDHIGRRYNGINTWKDIPHKRDKDKIYIDLYHDPIDGCVFHSGYNPGKRKYPSPSDFKGNYSFFGDIHLRQFFSKKTKGYASSLIQQGFGEDPFGHGYLLWNIGEVPKKTEDSSRIGIFTVEEIDIENDYRFIKFDINPGTDYDKLHLISKYIGKYNKFRVEWNEYAALTTNENRKKIEKYLKEKYDADDIEIRPHRIYTDIKDGKMLSEVIDINNKEVQQNIIKDYLKENKFDSEFIEKIIEIDGIINDRLHLSDTRNIVWNVDKLWFNNFKSYGDDNVIQWDNINGVVQIGGENQQGKTSIIDAICFILYGTTLSTKKTEKNGNNRYINKNRNLNFCDGGAVININGEKYIMYRKVEREFKKGREIKAVPMTLDYYKGAEMTEENKLTGERKTSTQKLLDEVLGNFDDFVRMALTNADNLNDLLSMDRSVFIDSIIKDSGYDVFEKKLNEFKEYKKELNLEKINVNQSELENETKRITEDLKDKEDYLSDTITEIEEIEKQTHDLTIKKDDLLVKIHKIDEDVSNINIEEINEKIDILKKEKSEILTSLNEAKQKMEGLPTEFDEDNYDKMIAQQEKYTTDKNKKEIELLKLENIYKQNEEKIKNVDRDIQIEKNKYIDHLRNNIGSFKVEKREMLNEIINNSNIKKNEFENQINKLKNDINLLKQKGLQEKQNISNYNEMLNGDDQICPTCNQLILNKDEIHINKLITESTDKIRELADKAKPMIESISDLNNKIESLKTVTDKLLEEKSFEYDDKIKSYQDKIDNFSESLIQDRIEEVINNKITSEKDNETLIQQIEERKNYLIKVNKEIKNLALEILNLKQKKYDYETYKGIRNDGIVLNSKYKDAQREIEINTKLLDDYNKNEKLILENKLTQDELKLIKENIDNLNSKKRKLSDDRLVYSNEITLSRRVIDDLMGKLERYIEQEKREEIHNVYLKLMHRTGLPTYLLTKNIDILNDELNSLLTNINFNLFFDEDLNLKLQHDGLGGVINALEASGAERVFSSIVLKMILRVINFKSKPDFMFLDEILNRMVGKSVERFFELLEVIKSRIDKIIIIEHNVEVPSDIIIQCKKEENGISKFEII